MSHKKINFIIIGIVFLAVIVILLGCSSFSREQKPVSEKGSAQLWQETCAQCHNLRSPSSYSDDQWQVAMHHMRIRGYLTGEEQRKILEYLQASN